MASNGVNGEAVESTELWRHPRPESTEFYAFQQHVAKKHAAPPSSYKDLWQWSVDHPDVFWEEVWHYTGIKASKQYEVGGRCASGMCGNMLTHAIVGTRPLRSHVPKAGFLFRL